MDVLNQWGRTRDMTIVGMGQSELDDVAADVAARLGRTLDPDPEPEKGFYYRSDHFSFAKAGIPAFYADPVSSTSTSRRATASRSARSTPRTTTTRCRTR